MIAGGEAGGVVRRTCVVRVRRRRVRRRRVQQAVRAQQRALAALRRVQREHVHRARVRRHHQPRAARHAADRGHGSVRSVAGQSGARRAGGTHLVTAATARLAARGRRADAKARPCASTSATCAGR